MSEPIFDEKEAFRGSMPTYNGFLMDKINKIYEAWDQGFTELALDRAIRLVTFLPKPLKEKLHEDTIVVTKELETARKLQGSDFLGSQQYRNKTTDRIAVHRLQQFVDRIIDYLYERGYLEKVSHYPIGGEI